MVSRQLQTPAPGPQLSSSNKPEAGLSISRPDHFVNRKDESGLVKALVDDVRKRIPVQKSLINFSGVPGIGKTSLLGYLASCYALDADINIIELSLDKLGLMQDKEQASLGQIQFTVDLMGAKVQFLYALAQTLPDTALGKDTLAQIESLREAKDEQRLDGALERITQSLLSSDHILLLVIDTWDAIPEGVLSWFERLLLLPLIRTNALIALFGSQWPLRWRQFEVRRKVKEYALEPLNQADTLQQLDLQHNPHLAAQIYDITHGHPFANKLVYERVKQHGATSLEADHDFLKTVLRHLVDDLQRRVLVNISQEIAHILKLISTLREFDVTTLRGLLPKFFPEFQGRSQSSLLASIKHLVETRLVTWNDSAFAFQLDRSIRFIFAQALQRLDPELYAAMQRQVILYYETLIREVPGNRSIYLLEYYYHMLSAAEAGSIDSIQLQSSLKQSIATYYVSRDGSYVDTEGIGQLSTMLQHDREFQSVLLKHNITLESFAAVLDSWIITPRDSSDHS